MSACIHNSAPLLISIGRQPIHEEMRSIFESELGLWTSAWLAKSELGYSITF